MTAAYTVTLGPDGLDVPIRITEAGLREIAIHSDPRWRGIAAGCPATPAEVLDLLAADPDPYVRLRAEWTKGLASADVDRVRAYEMRSDPNVARRGAS